MSHEATEDFYFSQLAQGNLPGVMKRHAEQTEGIYYTFNSVHGVLYDDGSRLEAEENLNESGERIGYLWCSNEQCRVDEEATFAEMLFRRVVNETFTAKNLV